VLGASRGSLLHLAGWLFRAPASMPPTVLLSAIAALPTLTLSGCGSSASGSIQCMQSLADYCQTSPCVMHLQLSSDTGIVESSFCATCGPSCEGQLYLFEQCEDGTLALATQVGMATANAGVEILTYFYDASSLDLTAVIDSTMGGTDKASLTCLGGEQTLSSHGVCATHMLSFQCP
jgi:hypothetical protein